MNIKWLITFVVLLHIIRFVHWSYKRSVNYMCLSFRSSLFQCYQSLSQHSASSVLNVNQIRDTERHCKRYILVNGTKEAIKASQIKMFGSVVTKQTRHCVGTPILRQLSALSLLIKYINRSPYNEMNKLFDINDCIAFIINVQLDSSRCMSFVPFTLTLYIGKNSVN